MQIEAILSLQGPQLSEAVTELEQVQTIEQLYLVFRHHYLKSDLAAMGNLMRRHADLVASTGPWFESLLNLRLAIRSKTKAVPGTLLSGFETVEPAYWRAEAHMVLAMYREEQADDPGAQESYLASAAAFAAAGMKRKSLIARFNAFACQTRIEPEKKYFVELQSFADEAARSGCPDLAGVALANLSRDCHLVGAVELALKHVEEAQRLLREHDFGSLHYYLTAAHRLNLLLQLGRWDEAVVPYEELLVSPFKEAAEIKAVVDRYLDHRPVEIAYDHLPATWRERLTELFARRDVKFTGKEGVLVETLTQGPLSIHELAGRIYGEKIDHESGIARTKQLLHRLKKKAPGLLVAKGGKYALG